MAQTITTINLDTMKKLPPEIVKIIMEESVNYEKAAVKDGQQRYQKGLTDLVILGKKKGQYLSYANVKSELKKIKVA